MKILESIKICLPDKDSDFQKNFLGFLKQFGKRRTNSVSFQKSNELYYPRVDLEFGTYQVPAVFFESTKKINVELVNKTNQSKKSPYSYSPISLFEFISRSKSLNFEFLDHIGFDIPWFDGLNPDIKNLRDFLSSQCLYYLYPTGENWDFILPATEEEILTKNIDYKTTRRSKFEIVSLDYTSSPIIQFDMSVSESFEEIKKVFPEGIPDNFLKNIWIYIENPYGLDICFVVGHRSKTDWYKFLKNGLIK